MGAAPEARRPNLPRLVAGGALLTLGALLLVGQVLDLRLALLWPVFVLVPGLVLLIAGLASRRRGTEGLTIAGSIITIVALLLAYQNATNHWESWAYGWALVAPGGVGIALLLEGLVNGRRDLGQAGRVLLAIGLVLFTVGFVLFEGVLGISGRRIGLLGDIALPAALILIGLLVVFGRRRSSQPAGADPSTAHPVRPTGTTAPREELAGPNPPSPGPPGPDAPPGPDPLAGSAPDPPPARTEATTTPVEVAYEDTDDLHLHLATGACRMTLRPGGADTWVRGTYRDPSGRRPVRMTREAPGRVRIGQEQSVAGWSGIIDGAQELDLSLGTGRPFRLSLDTGASESDAELGGVPLTGLRVRHGAGKLTLAFGSPNPAALDDLTLTAGAGATEVRGLGNANASSVHADGGAASLRLDLGGAAARPCEVRVSLALATVELDVPAAAAVAVHAESPLGGLLADPSFVRRGAAYWSAGAVEAGAPTFTVHTSVAVGQVRLRAT